VLNEIKERRHIILFIDEIHTIIGAGSTSGSAMDVGNLLKPPLSNGQLCCIGSTTFEEHKKIFERDKALVRRFQTIEINEPSVAESYAIVTGLASNYEAHHQAHYSREALKSAVDLSVRFLPERHLPDKALDALDEAGAYVALFHTETNREVTAKVVAKMVARMANQPDTNLNPTDKFNLLALADKLKQSVFGQNEAIDILTAAIKRSRAGLRSPSKPMASFLFVGPTGVGKTELARVLGQKLTMPLLRFDMSEYQEKQSVSRLIGSPPGYVGYEEGGILIDALRKSPYAVLLLDEIEKAHSDIYNVLLQAMDYATLTDTQGRKADLRNVIIIMTSNAGASELNWRTIGFENQFKGNEAINSAVEKIFSPEFRNRLDKTIIFKTLDEEAIELVTQKELENVKNLLKAQNIGFNYTAKVLNYLANKGYTTGLGARPLAQLIEDEVKEPLVDKIINGELQGKRANLTLKEGKLHYTFTAKSGEKRDKVTSVEMEQIEETI
jgi:ATP-dependent Clp protease ATP-binding subunit ClpA